MELVFLALGFAAGVYFVPPWISVPSLILAGAVAILSNSERSTFNYGLGAGLVIVALARAYFAWFA